MGFDDTIEMILANAKQAKAMTTDQVNALLAKTEADLAHLPPVAVTFSKIQDHTQEINASFDKLEACFVRMIQRVDRMIAASVENRAIIARIEGKMVRDFGLDQQAASIQPLIDD